MNPAPEGMGAVCALRAPATGRVEYGETEAFGLRCDAAEGGFLPYEERARCFRLTGLQPGKTYFSRVHAVTVSFGYGQLTVGGPIPEEATVVRVEANRREPHLTVLNLEGETLIREDFEA